MIEYVDLHRLRLFVEGASVIDVARLPRYRTRPVPLQVAYGLKLFVPHTIIVSRYLSKYVA